MSQSSQTQVDNLVRFPGALAAQAMTPLVGHLTRVTAAMVRFGGQQAERNARTFADLLTTTDQTRQVRTWREWTLATTRGVSTFADDLKKTFDDLTDREELSLSVEEEVNRRVRSERDRGQFGHERAQFPDRDRERGQSGRERGQSGHDEVRTERVRDWGQSERDRGHSGQERAQLHGEEPRGQSHGQSGDGQRQGTEERRERVTETTEQHRLSAD